jgi:hypothetical protein
MPPVRAVLQVLQVPQVTQMPKMPRMPRPKTMRERSPMQLFRDRNRPASQRDP